TFRKRQSVRCHLPDYRLAFNKEARNGKACANIIPSKGDRVWGAVYLCDSDAIKELDGWEGYPKHYDRKWVEVIADDGKVFKAIAYVAVKVIPETRPSDDYLKRILDGAKEHELPKEYIEQIESIAGR
ncbi:MAG TPA: gamma-glutamylcyclotransferase family protein, partial [Blastocatellia bacterium]|nr:gamma-glutamylcyclotransferase family protein [Blastocatellia bacterium]